jgi:hypothetical protein
MVAAGVSRSAKPPSRLEAIVAESDWRAMIDAASPPTPAEAADELVRESERLGLYDVN